MRVKDLITKSVKDMPVVIGYVTRKPAPCYSTTRYRSLVLVSYEDLDAHIVRWWIEEGTLMLEVMPYGEE